MRVRLGTLRRLVNEVALSPSVFKNNSPVKGPLDKPGIQKAVQSLENAFRQGLEMDLVVSMASSYDQQSGQFDDGAYEQVKGAVAGALDKLSPTLEKLVDEAWSNAHQQVKAGAQKQTPAKQPPQQAQPKETSPS